MLDKILNKLDDFIDKVEILFSKIISQKWLKYVLIFPLIFLVYYFGFKNKIRDLSITDSKYIKVFLLASFILISTIIGLVIFNNKSSKFPIHKKFLIISLVLGIIYTFASPVFSQSDESFHFIRAYQIADGNFISPYDANGTPYDKLPESIYTTLWDDNDFYPEYKKYGDLLSESKIKLDKNKVVRKDIRAANYIFLNYLPQSIGIKIGIILNLPPYFCGLLGRLFNVIICTLLLYIGLKILPVGQKTMTLLLISPTVIAYNASMSADGLVTAMALLLISLVLKCLYDKPKLNKKWYLLFLIIISFVSTCKTAYLPLIGILLFLPYECFKDKKSKWLYTISLILLGIVMSIGWMKISNIQIESASNVSLITRCIKFIKVFICTMANDIISYIQNIFAGNYLYQAQVRPYGFVSILYIFIFIFSYLSEKTAKRIRLIQKTIVFSIGFLILALVSFAMFAGNTSIDADLINGIQGRYFVPILLMFPFFINKERIKLDYTKLYNVALLINLCVLFTMLQVFIV